MAAPLKFKPYVPVPQRPRKSKHAAPASRWHQTDVALPGFRDDGQASQSITEGLQMNDLEDVMTIDLTGLDWSDDMQSVRQLVEMCTTSNSGGNEVREHSSTSLSLAPQLSLAAETPEVNPGDSQNQGSVIIAEDDQDTEVGGMSPTLMDPASPATVLDPTVDVVDDAAQAALTQPSAGTAMQSPRLLRPGLDQRGDRGDASISSPALSASAPAPNATESPCLEGLLDDDVGFQRWLDAGQQQDSAPNSKQLNRPLEDSENGNGTDDEREAKRPRLPSIAERGALLRQPDVCKIASAPVDDTIDAHGRPRRLLPNRHVKRSHNRNCDDNPLALNALARYPTRSFHPATAQRGGPPIPPASIRSDAAAFSSRQPPGRFASRPYGDAMTSQPPMAGTPLLPRAGPPPALPFSGAQEMGQTGQCKSCAIFRAALFEALSLLRHPSYEGVSSNTWHGQPMSNVLKRRYSLRKRSTPPESGCKESDEISLGCMGEHCSRSDYDGVSSSDEDGSVSVKARSRNVSVKRRRWSELEERRLRAWKRENKSESWIASKLNRTVAAVKQQWRKMSEEK